LLPGFGTSARASASPAEWLNSVEKLAVVELLERVRTPAPWPALKDYAAGIGAAGGAIRPAFPGLQSAGLTA
jgi:hypothetical protein